MLIACGVAACLVWPTTAQTTEANPPAWPHTGSDIQPDQAVTFGVLANGMRYALMPNRLPTGAVSIRFVMSAGSFHEGENERGLVHFIEHMAFNGSKHVPEGELVRILERLGLAFGADANATTGRSETIYRFDLPNASDGALDEILFLLREMAGELSFDPAAIERERGVILAEYRRGDTYERRRAEAQLGFLFPGAYVATRSPIGDAKIIAQAQQRDLTTLYESLYRPDRALIVVVGDIEPAALATKLSVTFGDWKAKGDPPREPDLLYAPQLRAPAALAFEQLEGGDSVAVYAQKPFEVIHDSAASRREGGLFNIAMGIVARRFTRLAEGTDPPFRRASMSYYDIWRAVDVAAISATITPGNWKVALESLEQEWRRALVHGFTEDEVDEQLTGKRADLQQVFERRDTRTSPELATRLLGSILDDVVFSSIAEDLTRFEVWAPEVDAAAVEEVFRRRMKLDHPLFLLATSEPQPDAAGGIPLAWTDSGKVPVAPPEHHIAPAFAYADFGAPGEVVKDTRLPDIDTRLVMFANNVRLNIKRTDFQANTVLMSLRVGEGALGLEEAPFGLSSLMSAYVQGGLEEQTPDDLRLLFNGRNVQGRFSAYPDAFGGTYKTTPDDLELQLQLAAAFMLHPGYRADAEQRWRENIRLSWRGQEANAQSTFSNRGVRLLMGGDRRFGSDPDDGVADRSFAELKTHIEPMLRRGAIEIAIVGDIDEGKAIALVAKTFGALPMRAPSSTILRSLHPVTFRSADEPLRLTHQGEQDQAMVGVFWPINVDPDASPQVVREANALGSIMRLKSLESLREQLGASYSPSAGASVSSIYPGLAYLYVSAEVKPEDADLTVAAVRSIAQQLREGHISDDELQRAIQPVLEQLPAHLTSNEYWLALIAEAQGRPERTARSKVSNIETSVRAITIGDLVTTANLWLQDADAREVRVLPSPSR